MEDEREKAEAEARRLRLELAETNRRLAKAKKGKKVAEKVPRTTRTYRFPGGLM